jgi:hypothetical protein
VEATLPPHPLPGGPTATQQLDSQQDQDPSTQVWAQVGWGAVGVVTQQGVRPSPQVVQGMEGARAP